MAVGTRHLPAGDPALALFMMTKGRASIFIARADGVIRLNRRSRLLPALGRELGFRLRSANLTIQQLIFKRHSAKPKNRAAPPSPTESGLGGRLPSRWAKNIIG